MPYRTTPFVNEEVYHTYNRGIASQNIFYDKRDYRRALELIAYYRFDHPLLRYSYYNRLHKDLKNQMMEDMLKEGKYLIEILAFCLLPNHFHFLLKQKQDKGIPLFMANFQNSYAKYFNTKNERHGSLVETQFKANHIESEEQLLHVSRYIHLNPVTSYLIKPQELVSYPWSSYPNYLKRDNTLVKCDDILANFSKRNSYQQFVLDQVDYQRELRKIKDLDLEG